MDPQVIRPTVVTPRVDNPPAQVTRPIVYNQQPPTFQPKVAPQTATARSEPVAALNPIMSRPVSNVAPRQRTTISGKDEDDGKLLTHGKVVLGPHTPPA